MALVPITLFALLAGLALGLRLGLRGAGAPLLLAATFACAELVLVQTLLGGLGLLRPPLVVLGCLLASAGVALAALAGGREPLVRGARELVRDLARGARLLRRPELALLAAAALAAWLWAAAAAAYLPPRGVDDLGHHLPPILEAAALGRFVLLPLELLPWFAYPLNADLLPLATLELGGTTRWLDGAGLATIWVAALAVAAIARELGASRRSSALAALVFALTPVALKQASSAYTDVTIAAFYGAALVGALRYAREGGRGALLLCGIASGLLAGTKYHLLLPLAFVWLLALAGLQRKAGWRRPIVSAVAWLLAPAVLLSGYWYARNLVALGNPFYPYGVATAGIELFPPAVPAASGLAGSGSLAKELLIDPLAAGVISLTDMGAGGVDGGFGPLFWGAVLPASLALSLREGKRGWRARRTWRLLVALQFPAALLPYLVTHAVTWHFTVRFLLPAAVCGCAWLALALDGLRAGHRALGRAAAWAVVLTAAVAALPVAGNTDPIERKQLTDVAEARAGAAPSPWHYVRNASFGVGALAPAWSLLDHLGAPGRPLWIYATGEYTAGYYGTSARNRVWNFDDPARPARPDALSFARVDQRESGSMVRFGAAGPTLEQALADTEGYELVLVTPLTSLFVARAQVAPGGPLAAALASYYAQAFPGEVQLAASLDRPPASGTILVAHPVGYGLKALELRGEVGARVILRRDPPDPAAAPSPGWASPLFVVARRSESAGPPAATFRADGHDLVLYEMQPQAGR